MVKAAAAPDEVAGAAAVTVAVVDGEAALDTAAVDQLVG